MLLQYIVYKLITEVGVGIAGRLLSTSPSSSSRRFQLFSTTTTVSSSAELSATALLPRSSPTALLRVPYRFSRSNDCRSNSQTSRSSRTRFCFRRVTRTTSTRSRRTPTTLPRRYGSLNRRYDSNHGSFNGTFEMLRIREILFG